MKQFIVGKGYGHQTGQVQSDPLVTPVFAPIRGPVWGDAGATDAFKYSHPWSVAGSFKNLYVEIMWPEEIPTGGGWDAIDFELYINGSPSGLSVTVPAASPAIPPPGYLAFASNTTDTATISPGDTVAMVRGAGQIPPSFNQFTAWIAWSMTFESDNEGESGYGISSYATGLLGATNILYAAAFNGIGGFALDDPSVPVVSSVVPLIGDVTRLDVALSVAPGTGKHRSFAMVLNSVVQDGTGGTVDTTVTISDGATTGHSTFTLPIAVLDLLAVGQLVSTTPAASLVTCSLAVTADTDGEFALGFYDIGPDSSGATDYTSGYDGGFANSTARAPTPWSTSKANRYPVSEYTMSAPGPIDPFTLSDLCVHLSAGPGTGNSWLFTTRKAGTDTPGTVTAADTDTLVVGTSSAGSFSAPTDRMDLAVVGTSSPVSGNLSWTWLVTATVAPPIVSTSYPIRRQRRCQLLYNQNKWIRINRIELILQAGVGLSTGQGSDPLVMFRLSRDGGMTWDSELTMEIGKIGEYERRAFLNMLGRARNPVGEFTSSDPVFTSWISLTVDYDEGTS